MNAYLLCLWVLVAPPSPIELEPACGAWEMERLTGCVPGESCGSSDWIYRENHCDREFVIEWDRGPDSTFATHEEAEAALNERGPWPPVRVYVVRKLNWRRDGGGR